MGKLKRWWAGERVRAEIDLGEHIIVVRRLDRVRRPWPVRAVKAAANALAEWKWLANLIGLVGLLVAIASLAR